MTPGHKQGRRPAHLRIEKAELDELMKQLHDRGLGCTTIGRLLGFSERTIRLYMQDFGLPHLGPGAITKAIVKHLPPELELRCRRARTKSMIAKDSRLVQLGLKQGKTVHQLMDDDEETCCNVGGAVRPEKAVA